ncbi:MAG: flagellar biosynthetic protein FliR, partial [Deltaproteobacteria bacterium]|nr:flagellar biosynthetic protein FliR [Deltaproteobacteria bacterium]
DPFNGAAGSGAGQLFSMLTLGLAVAANIHGEAVAWLARSVATPPPGQEVELTHLAQTVITSAIWACALSVRLAMPFAGAALLAHVGMGVLGRAAPQLNLSSIGFSLSLAAGGTAIYLLAPMVAEVAVRAAMAVFA